MVSSSPGDLYIRRFVCYALLLIIIYTAASLPAPAMLHAPQQHYPHHHYQHGDQQQLHHYPGAIMVPPASLELEDGHPDHELYSRDHITGLSTSVNGHRPHAVDGARLHDNATSVKGEHAKFKSLQSFLDSLIDPAVYDRRIRPFYNDKVPCNITMTVHINSISAINEVTMDFNIDLYLRQMWKDPRLRYEHTTYANASPLALHYDLIDRIWMPDSFFRNAKEGKRSDITVPNRLTRIYNDGYVLYSQRLLLKLDCPMKLQKFPLDNQTCIINIGSYGFTLEDLKFEWSTNESPIGMSTIQMPDFRMEEYQAVICKRETSTGAFPCLEIKLYLQRLFGYYLVQVYIPTILLVIMSFVSFWIDYRSAPARISMAFMSVLAVVTQSSGIRGQLPRVSYIKAIDVWMSMCLVFAFFALLEYAVVNVVARKAEQGRQQAVLRNKQVSMRHVKSSIIQRIQNGSIIGSKLATAQPARKQILTSCEEQLLSAGRDCSPVPSHQRDNSLVPLATPAVSRKLSSTAPQMFGFVQGPRGSSTGCQSASLLTSTTAPTVIDVITDSKTTKKSSLPPPRDLAATVDQISAFIFPTTFIVFNFVYWSVYLNMTV